MIFPKSARYKKIMHAACNLLTKNSIDSFPVDPFSIINKYSWGVITYSELALKHSVTIDDICRAYQSKDGFTIYDGVNYTIAYNDTITIPGRIRFTLMHEIGHIYLRHLTDFKETILRRSELSKSKYKILEREANAFARNVLSPPIIVSRLIPKFGASTIKDIVRCFNISVSATHTRLKMLKWDTSYMGVHTSTLLPKFQGYINRILDSKQCLKCKHYFISRFASFCPICAHTRFSKRKGELSMIYSGFETVTNGRVVKCPRCDNEEIKDEDLFCKICASPVINLCRNSNIDPINGDEWKCGAIADGSSRFCTRCGHTTAFNEAGLLTPWEEEQHEENNKSVAEDFADIPF